MQSPGKKVLPSMDAMAWMMTYGTTWLFFRTNSNSRCLDLFCHWSLGAEKPHEKSHEQKTRGREVRQHLIGTRMPRRVDGRDPSNQHGGALREQAGDVDSRLVILTT